MSITQKDAAKLINDVKKEARFRNNASPQQTPGKKMQEKAMMGKTHSPSGALYKDNSSGNINDKERKNSGNKTNPALQ